MKIWIQGDHLDGDHRSPSRRQRPREERVPPKSSGQPYQLLMTQAQEQAPDKPCPHTMSSIYNKCKKKSSEASPWPRKALKPVGRKVL
jgi:hypothetical protein